MATCLSPSIVKIETGRLTPIEVDSDDRSSTNSGRSLVNTGARPKRVQPRPNPAVVNLKIDSSASNYSADDEKRSTGSSFDGSSLFSSSVSPQRTLPKSKFGAKSKHDFYLPLDEASSDSDSGYFCVDHMKLCRTRVEMRKHRKCHHGLPSYRQPSSRHVQSDVSMSSAGESPGSSSSRHSPLTQSLHEEYRDKLKRMYDYSGLMIEDRETLKTELCDRKEAIQEYVLAAMEDRITQILKIKNEFLARLSDVHETNLDHVTQQNKRIHKLRYEAQGTLEHLKMPEGTDNIKACHEMVYEAAKKAKVFKEILQNIYDSSNRIGYDLEISSSMEALFQIEDIGCASVRASVPRLPPFLHAQADEREFDELTREDRHRHVVSELEFVTVVSEGQPEKVRCFTGCACVHSNSVLLVDQSNSALHLIKTSGILSDSLEFDQSPWDVVAIGDGQAAVTVPKSRTVFHIDSSPTLKIMTSFKTKGECYGICKIGDNYAVTCDSCSKLPSLHLLDEDGRQVWKIDRDIDGRGYFRCPLYVGADFLGTTLYVSDSTASSVFTVSLTGEILTCFTDPRLVYPAGISTDRGNDVYVCGKRSSVVHKLRDNEFVEEFIEQTDGIKNPAAITRHPDGNHFILVDNAVQNASGFWKLPIH